MSQIAPTVPTVEQPAPLHALTTLVAREPSMAAVLDQVGPGGTAASI